VYDIGVVKYKYIYQVIILKTYEYISRNKINNMSAPAAASKGPLNIGAGIGIGILALIIMNNNASDNLKFALVIGLIAAFALRGAAGGAPAGGHH